MNSAFTEHLRAQLRALETEGLLKRERVITTPQGAWVEADGRRVVNLCANNYLGLAGRPELVTAAQEALPARGFGLSSVRFICGTQDVHKDLEARLARFLGFEDAILFSSCFDANGGVFEALLGEEDAVVSDALNHASIIDGIRLCKARRYRYANGDMADLDARLREADAAGARFKLVVTDGVFSMDGYLANLPEICDIAERHGALVMVDDSHAVGFIGEKGRGTPEHLGVMGGWTSSPARSGRRSAARRAATWRGLGGGGVAPPEGAPVPVLEHARPGDRGGERRGAGPRGAERRPAPQAPRERRPLPRRDDAARLRAAPRRAPDRPGDAARGALAQEVARRLLDEGVYAIGFFFPVVPKGQARIRTQMSAAHSREDLDFAVRAFAKVGRALGIIRGRRR